MKKGFTLIELLGVIILLGVLALIVYPVVDSSIKQSRQRAYDRTIDGILAAARTYGTNNKLGYDSKANTIELGVLKESGYLENKDILDPRNNQTLNGCVIYRWNYDDNQYEYSYDEQCTPVTPTNCFDYQIIDYSSDFDINYEQCKVYITNYSNYGFSDDELDKYCRGESGDYGESLIADIKLGKLNYLNLIKNDVISNYTTQKGVVISNYDMSCGVDVILPQSIESYPVVSIDDYSFSEMGIETVDFSLAKDLEYIGNGSFAINNITAIDFSHNNKLKQIGTDCCECEGAFTSNKISNIKFSDSIVSLGDYTFRNNQLTSVKIPKNANHYGEDVFAYNHLSQIEFPENITCISRDMFANNQLTEVHLPSNITNIESGAFSDNQLSGELDLSYLPSLQYIAGFDGNQLTNVILPNSITNIGNYAFSDNQFSGELDLSHLTSLQYVSGFRNNQLTNVILPNSLTNIGYYAFSNNQLTSIIIPNNVTNIDYYAFSNNQLSNAIIGNNVVSIGLWAFYNNRLVNLIIPNSVEEIGSSAFERNQLTNVTIGNKVTKIELDAFYKSSSSNQNLTKVVNKTNKIFNWGKIINGSYSSTSYNFATGTVVNSAGNVEITAE